MNVEWQAAVALVVTPGAVMIALIYFIRDIVQEQGNRQNEQDRIGAAKFKEGTDATIALTKELHHEFHVGKGTNESTATAPVTRPARTEDIYSTVHGGAVSGPAHDPESSDRIPPDPTSGLGGPDSAGN